MIKIIVVVMFNATTLVLNHFIKLYPSLKSGHCFSYLTDQLFSLCDQ